MELVVKVIDIRYNKEKAKKFLSRSAKLHGYSLLLNYIKGYLREGNVLAQAINLAVDRCIEVGRAEGREEEQTEEKKRIAQKLLAMDLNVDAIAKATGLTLEEIRHLKDANL